MCERHVKVWARSKAQAESPNRVMCEAVTLMYSCSYEDDEFAVNNSQIIQELRVEVEHKMEQRYKS